MVRISDVQGTGLTSLLEGQLVTIDTAIVTAIDSNGFYLQDTVADGIFATSDGIFVFTGSAPTVVIGDEVRVVGTVTEFTPGGVNSGNLSTTQISSPIITTLSRNNILPAPVRIGLPTKITSKLVVRIGDVQGTGLTSLLEGQLVTINTAIVTAVDSNGFYLQDTVADGNIATSDGIFVFTGSAPTVVVGDEVRVVGTVTEFTPGGVRSRNLSTTQISRPTITTLSRNNVLPAPVRIGSPTRIPPNSIISPDGINFFESLEGMRVTVQQPIAVAPTNRFKEIYTLSNNGQNATGVNNNGGITISPQDFNPERIQIDVDRGVFNTPTPNVNVGDRLSDVTGVVGYAFGNYEVIPTEAFTVITPGNLAPETTNLVSSIDRLTIATFNVENLDPNDADGDRDIADGKFNAIAAQIVNNLRSPDIIGLQEIQDNSGSAKDGVVSGSLTYLTLINAIIAAGGPAYSFAEIAPVNNTSGGQPGGNIRVGYLYRSDRVSLVPNSLQAIGQGNPAFNRSRQSLAARFQFNGQEVTILNNHFTSKGGSDPLFGAIQPPANGGVTKREQQAQAVNNFVDNILATDPNAKVVVLGDLNEFQFSTPLDILKGGNNRVLSNLTKTLVPSERYTYNFQGNSQALDHILVSNSINNLAQYDIVHVNSEFTNQASDHDPAVVRLNLAATPPVNKTFTLQLLHASDQEAGIPALENAPRFSAVLNALRNQDANKDGILDYRNTLTLSSGDVYIPGLFLDASADPSLAPLLGRAGRGRADIIIQNELGFEAIAFGNHEFDLGTELVRSLIAPDGAYPGANFPYLSSNLNFTTDPHLAPLVTADGQEARSIPGRIAGNSIITVNGEKIGVVGLTTPILASISSPGSVGISPANSQDLVALAAIVQSSVDSLIAANPGLNKVILLSHLQQISLEQQLAPLLRDVDIIMAGGSNTLLADATDRLRAGDVAQGPYPILSTAADGKAIAIINTEGNYQYVGRLVVDFDANGVIIPTSIDPNISGAYATDAQGVTAVNGTPDPEIVAITDALRQVILNLDSNFFGITNVFLNGDRGDVRTQETNLGNLTADANLAIARQSDSSVVISIKNGGGIRDNIGEIVTPPGGLEPVKLPPAGNELTKRPPGGISQASIQNTLRFNNGLTLLSATASELVNVIETALSQTAPGATPGGFPQISGLRFSFNPDLPVGQRVKSLAVVDETTGAITDIIASNGRIQGNPNRSFRLVTLSFLADGGNGYTFNTLSAPNRVDLAQADTAPRSGLATFAANGSEQDALAEFLGTNFGATNPFNIADTTPEGDLRIQNLNFRLDTIVTTNRDFNEIIGSINSDEIIGTANNDIIRGLDGNDTLRGRSGNDLVNGGNGNDLLRTGSGIDSLNGGIGNDTLHGGADNDVLTGGTGKDYFSFLNPNQGIDTINDFNIVDNDRIRVSAAGFGGGLVTGRLNPTLLHIGSSATTVNHRFVYDNTTGALFFDSDGVGGLAQQQFAILANKSDLFPDSFSVVA